MRASLASDSSAAAAAAATRGAFDGIVSDAFEGSLRYYVVQEQREVGGWEVAKAGSGAAPQRRCMQPRP